MHKMTFCKKKNLNYMIVNVCVLGWGVLGLIQEEAACLGRLAALILLAT